MSKRELLNRVADAATRVRAENPRSVVLLHHNDTGGLCSGAALLRAFTACGLQVRRYCLEKPYPHVVKHLFADPCDLMVVTDFGSGMLGTFSALRGGQRCLVLDHHSIEAVDDPGITLVNCRSYGVSGDDECSAATVCALFARALVPLDPGLGVLSLLGPLADGQTDGDGNLTGVNGDLAAEFMASATLRRTDHYEVKLPSGSWLPARTLIAQLDALGSIGYLSGGPEIGLRALLEGPDSEYASAERRCRAEYDRAFSALLRTNPVRGEGLLRWFTLGEEWRTMGVKTVGVVCERLLREGAVPEDSYIAGFQTIPDQIPGLGALPRPRGSEIKVSMRVGAALRSSIDAGTLPPLTEILPAATRAVGGFVDACHRFAAATVIPRGSEEELIAGLQARLPSR